MPLLNRLQEAKILIVDDSQLIREMATAMLRQAGVVHIHMVKDGIEALAALEHFSPDLILSDITMPHMDGLELCRKIRKEHPTLYDVPVVIMTGLNKLDDRVRSLQVGVNSILFKPLSQSDIMRSVISGLEQKQVMKQIEEADENNPIDDSLVKKIERLLLPDKATINACSAYYGVSVEATFQACNGLGGDYWTIQPIDDDHIALCIADFAGHGVAAANNMLHLRLFMQEGANYNVSPAMMLNELNQHLCEMLQIGQYMTFFLGVINTKTHQLTYAGAGAPPVIIGKDTTTILLDCSGEPLGAFDDAVYHDKVIEFPVGSSAIMYSDALIEPNVQGKIPVSIKQLQQDIQQFGKEGSAALHKVIMQRVKNEHHHFDDDLTLVCVSYNGKPNMHHG